MELNNSSNETDRNNIISKLPLSKQFTLRSHLSQADSLNREQAIEMVKECLVHSAYKDYTFLTMLMSDMPKL